MFVCMFFIGLNMAGGISMKFCIEILLLDGKVLEKEFLRSDNPEAQGVAPKFIQSAHSLPGPSDRKVY